jgi:hypothetical protein
MNETTNLVQVTKLSSNHTVWLAVMALEDAGKDETYDTYANILNRDDFETVLATADFFGASRTDLQQIYMDLSFPRYRVFDWLAMCVNGRIESKDATKVFVYSFIKSGGVPSKFIEDLQVTDYDIDRRWEKIQL